MKKILVVGEDPEIFEDLSKHFDPQKYKLFSSCDPKSIITSATNLKPDLVILDLSYGSKFGNLPHHSGIEFLKKLKGTNSNLPIIAIAFGLSKLGDIDIIKEKIYGFVKRPVQPEKLLHMVDEALSTGVNLMAHPTTLVRRGQKDLEGVTTNSGESESPETVKIGCEKTQEGCPNGKKNYDQMFDQLLTPIYGKIMVNSKGNIYDQLVSGLEKSLISLTLKYCNHNQVKASQILGISRNTLRERIKRYDLW